MNSNIEFKKGVYGTKAVIKVEWQESFLELLLNKKVVELELNDGKGWRGDDVEFLEALPNLEALTIIDFKIKSIEPVHRLRKLKHLEVITYCKKPVGFHCFPKLIECSFEWIEGSNSLFE